MPIKQGHHQDQAHPESSLNLLKMALFRNPEGFNDMNSALAHYRPFGKHHSALLVGLVALLLPMVALGQDFVRTGTYLGDGQVSQEISGLGFQPDVVIVKAETDRRAIIRVTGMPEGKSKKLDDNKALEPDRLESFTADGFIVGNHDEINQDGILYYWVALKEVAGKLDVGQYVGDGNNLRTVTVDNMLPQAALIIPAGNDLCVYHAIEMDYYETYAFDGSGLVNDSIAWNDVNTIKVGTSHSVNENTKDYYFIALKSTENEIDEGSYFGNGQDGRTISDLGFDPEYTLIFNDNDALPVHRPRSLTGDSSLFFDSSPVQSNLLQSMEGGDFILGDDPGGQRGGYTVFLVLNGQFHQSSRPPGRSERG